MPFDLRIANAATSYVMYLWKTVWPVNLAIFYPHPAVLKAVSASAMIWHAVIAALVLAAITAGALWSARRQPYWAVGWLWYLGTLVPVIGLIQIGVQGMADRYTYLPTIGIYVAVVWGAAELATRYKVLRAPLVVAATVLLATWTAMAAHQTATWKNSFTVFEHAIAVVPDNFFAHNHLGLAYHNTGQMEKAGAEYKKAVQIAPHYDSANGNLGVYYASRGEIDKAVDCFRSASRINPYLASFHANLGAAYTAQGKLKEAEQEYRQAIKIDPHAPPYRGRLCFVLRREGRLADSLAQQRELIRLCPNDVVLLNETAWLLATNPDASLRNGVDAVAYARQAAQLSQGKMPTILGTLAAAYAEAGQFSEAVQTAHLAAELAVQQDNRPLADSINAKIPLYQAGTPYHEPPSPVAP